MSAEVRPGRDHEQLAQLLGDVNRARDRLLLSRQRASERHEHERLRSQLLAALEEYAAAAAASGTPLPYRLRDELRLHRRLPLA